ncbi:hypothetical protein ABPG75_009729 [Micractinium tetrahymenae]
MHLCLQWQWQQHACCRHCRGQQQPHCPAPFNPAAVLLPSPPTHAKQHVQGDWACTSACSSSGSSMHAAVTAEAQQRHSNSLTALHPSILLLSSFPAIQHMLSNMCKGTGHAPLPAVAVAAACMQG